MAMVLESDVAGSWQIFESRFELVLTAIRVLLGSCPSVEICRDDFMPVKRNLNNRALTANLNLIPLARFFDRVRARHHGIIEGTAVMCSDGCLPVRVQ